MKIKKISKSTIALLSVLLVLLISMVGTSLVQSNGGSVNVSTDTVSLKNLAAMIANNTKANGKKVDILFQQDENAKISIMTFIPKNASKESPAPCVICAHGYNNSKEMQLSNFTELSKRGFVVVALDLAGHGRSDYKINDLTKGTDGMLAAVEYAISLPVVDNAKIGVTGHSAGDLACANTIKIINAAKSNNHIAAFLCSSGTIASAFLPPQNKKDIIWGVSAGQYDELDTFYFNSNHFLDTPVAKGFLTTVYPKFSDTKIPEGQWYTANGPVAAPKDGTALGVKSAVAFWNPPITHPMGTFSTVATELSINFFYAAFGTPTGCSYIPATNQTWPAATVFQLLGLLAFFALMFPLVSVLLKTPVFSSLKREVTPTQDLPSIKSWKEWVPLVVTFIPLLLFPFFTYFSCYNAGATLFDTASFPMVTVNGIAWWTLCCGLFCILMLGVNYGLRKLCHRKDKETIYNPFTPGKLDGWNHFFKILGFVATVIVLMYIPCFIAYYIFHMNFGIAVYTVGLPRLAWLPDIVFKYLPFWIIFLVPNVILNADTRFRDLPEWATVLICAAANALPIMLLTFLNYRTLYTTGRTLYTMGDPSIMAFNLFAPMILIAISGRYIYNRTKDAWSAGMINAAILAFMALTLTRHMADFMFHF